jgi:integrase
MNAGTMTVSTVGTLAGLADDVRDFAAASMSENTRRAYASDWQTFATFARSIGADVMPATPDTVAAHLAALARAGRKASTVARAAAAIATAHKTAGHTSPTTHPAVVAVLAGIRRTLGTAPTKKAPVVVDDLRALVATCDATTAGLRDRAVLVVGFAGAFRRSEIAALTVADVAFDVDGVVVTLRRSKTDQEGAGRVVGLPYGSDPSTCPVRTLRRYLDAAGIVDGAVFRSVNRHGHVGGGLSGHAVAGIVKAHAAAASLDVARFSGHSLRAGHVTTAARAGKGLDVIMAQTGHTSPTTVMGYIRRASVFSANSAASIGL